MSAPSELASLAAEAEWVRRLARRLVSDAHAADDLAQDAWVAALEEPELVRSPRAWLARVVRNLARERHRSDARREARERDAAQGERQPSALDVVAEVSELRRVADLVLELDEPYRTVLLLRFYKERSLLDIAREQGVSTSTVHERLARGLALLRGRLERRHGRGAWMLALAPFIEREPGLVATALGGLAVTTATKLVAASAVLALGALGLWSLTHRAAVEPKSAPPAHLALAAEPDALTIPVAPVGPEVLSSAPARRESVARVEAVPSESAGAAPAPSPLVVRGRVIDLQERPVPGARVAYSAPQGADRTVASSDAGGEFTIDWREREGSLVVDDPALVTLIPGAPDADPASAPTIVVGRRERIAGRVVDPSGEPLAEVALEVLPSEVLFRDLRLAQEYLPGFAPSATESDADGRFELPEACADPRLRLRARKQGYGSASLPLPAHPTADWNVVLYPLVEAETLSGRVIDLDGAPVPGASVALGGPTAKTDANGEFVLRREPQLDKGVLRAVKPGYLPAEVPAPLDLRSPVVLQLGAEPLSIAGRVLDEDGAPVEGAAVWILDPTPFGLEPIGSGDSLFGVTAEAALSGHSWERGVVTAGDGSFRIDGLLRRDYRVRALDPVTLDLSEERTVAAGSAGVALALLPEGSRSRVAGRVVDPDGEPIAGMAVIPVRRIPGLTWSNLPDTDRDARAVTGPDGSFDLGEIATLHTSLRLLPGFDQPLPLIDVELAEQPDPEHVEIVHARACRLQIDLAGRGPACDAFEVLDAGGEALSLAVLRGNVVWFARRCDLDGERSDVVVATEAARELVLYAEGREVGRQSLRLAPGELSVIRP